jgi:hypothetical protein
MIFGRWGTCKTIRELRKVKKRLSLRNYAMTTEERVRESEKSLERFSKRIGKPIEVMDKPLK